MGEYSVRGWQYWPEHSEGQYRSRELNIPPYCPTQRSAVIDLLYDLHTVLLVVHAQGSIACSYFKIHEQTLTGNNRKLTQACLLLVTASYL